MMTPLVSNFEFSFLYTSLYTDEVQVKQVFPGIFESAHVDGVRSQ